MRIRKTLLIVFVTGFIAACSVQQIQKTVLPVHSRLPVCEAKNFHIKTRTVKTYPDCSNLQKISADSITETYDANGSLTSMLFSNFGSETGSTILHKNQYSGSGFRNCDSSFSNGTLYKFASYHHPRFSRKLTIAKTPEWADSSVKVFIRWKNHEIVSRTGIDLHGDTVYRYVRNGTTESEILYRRTGNKMEISSRKISFYETAAELRTTLYYDDLSDHYVFRMETEKYNQKGQLLRKDIYSNDSKLDETIFFTYSADGKAVSKTDTEYSASGITITRTEFSYTTDGKIEAVKTWYGNSAGPDLTESYSYNPNGLLVEIKTISGVPGATGKCTRFTYTYY